MGNKLSEMEWFENYELGFPEIDNDHRTLFETINQMIRLLARGERASCADLSVQVVETLRRHFPKEESFLEKIEYKWLDKHAAHHRKMLASAERLQHTFTDEIGGGDPEAVLPELIELILEDVRGTDLTFRTHLRDKGLEQAFDTTR